MCKCECECARVKRSTQLDLPRDLLRNLNSSVRNENFVRLQFHISIRGQAGGFNSTWVDKKKQLILMHFYFLGTLANESNGANVMFHSLFLSPSPHVEVTSPSCSQFLCISSYSQTALGKDLISCSLFFSNLQAPSSLFKAMIHTSTSIFLCWYVLLLTPRGPNTSPCSSLHHLWNLPRW